MVCCTKDITGEVKAAYNGATGLDKVVSGLQSLGDLNEQECRFIEAASRDCFIFLKAAVYHLLRDRKNFNSNRKNNEKAYLDNVILSYNNETARHRAYASRLSPTQKNLLRVRDESYNGDWKVLIEKFQKDRIPVLQGKETKNILLGIEIMRDYEGAFHVDLSDYLGFK